VNETQMAEWEAEAAKHQDSEAFAKPLLDLIRDHRAMRNTILTHHPPTLESWHPVGRVLRGFFDLLAAEPDGTLAVTAFVIGLVAPRHERICERVVVACLESMAKRKEETPWTERTTET
jgi:hypothetical protein